MRRRFLIIVSIFCALSAVAQDMKSVFVSMPDSIAPLLTQTNKEDCVDFLDSDLKAVVRNRFGNEAELKVLTGDYMLMQTSSVSTLEMKLLPVNDSVKVLCMVKTVCASACNSEVHFYTPNWEAEIWEGSFLHKPEAERFFLPSDSLTEESERIRKQADMHLMKVSLAKDDASLTFIYTTPDYLNKEDREELLPYLRKEPIVLRWQDGAFR